MTDTRRCSYHWTRQSQFVAANILEPGDKTTSVDIVKRHGWKAYQFALPNNDQSNLIRSLMKSSWSQKRTCSSLYSNIHELTNYVSMSLRIYVMSAKGASRGPLCSSNYPISWAERIKRIKKYQEKWKVVHGQVTRTVSNFQDTKNMHHGCCS